MAVVPAATVMVAHLAARPSSSSAVEVQFPSKDGKALPPPSLPQAKKLAVWPGDQREVMFAQKLQESGKFATVTSPASVSAVLIENRIPTDLAQLTAQDQASAFGMVCKRTGAALVLGARQQGPKFNSNLFSFSRANITYSTELLAYSCDRHELIWRDTMELVVGAGGGPNNAAEMSRAGAQAWAERVEQAMGYSSVAEAK